jgi:Trypsin-like peptidase domain
VIVSLTLATLVLAQELSTLHIKVTLTDAARGPVPIARAALLISDDPPTSAPRRVVTAADGTVTIRLRAGSYIIESDEAVAFGGKGYEWRTTLKVAAGRDAALELTAANAEVGPAPASTSARASSDTASIGASLPPQAQESVVAIWTPESRASGFLINTAGLVATNQRVVGGASTLEVQLARTLKVAARVLASDRARDVAILWIDPASTAAMHPVPLNCEPKPSPIAQGQKLIALGAPFRGEKEEEPGEVFRVEATNAVADFRLAQGSVGGPVFGAGGALVGLSSTVEDESAGRTYRSARDIRVVPLDEVCAVAGEAGKAMQTAQAPSAAHLPVEPEKPFDVKVLDEIVKSRQGSLNPYQFTSSSFDVSILTPVVIRGAQQRDASRGRIQQARAIDVTDFGEWSDYFEDVPPVVVVRVTPKMAESFWTSVGRAAAYTQGMAIPAIKHFKPGFLRMRAYCGDAEVIPIHPFTLTQRISETDAIREGLYVFEPQAFGPQCASVKLVMFSEKEPDKPDIRIVDAKVIEQIRTDFATYR